MRTTTMTRSLAVAAALLAGPTSAASAATLTVDDDRIQCRSAQFTTATGIQQAVAAAAPGDTIRVCPGTYTGPVAVPKPVSLVALARGAAAADAAPDPTRDAIVANTGTGGFLVAASDVRIAGFRIQGDALANGYPDAGIDVQRGTDRRFEFNLIEDNNLGVYLVDRQERVEIARNAIQGSIRPDNPSFIPTGGIFAAGGNGGLVDTAIRDNRFRSNEQFSINNGSGSERGFVVSGNRATDDGAFLVVGNTTRARVADNDVLRHRGSGMFLFGGNSDMLIAGNRLRDGTGSGVNDAGPMFGVVQPNRGTTVRDNVVTGSTASGVRLLSDPRAVVEDNALSRNNRGIDLATQGALIAGNELRDNRKDGLEARVTSADNRIVRNVLLGNLEHDCHDDSLPGPGSPATTSNFWFGNVGVTETDPGLCAGDDDDDDEGDGDDDGGDDDDDGDGDDDGGGDDDD